VASLAWLWPMMHQGYEAWGRKITKITSP